MKGKAAVFTAVGEPMVIREFELPEVEPGAVLVKVSLANICGSDLHIWHGELAGGPGKGPRILGHEMMGRVHQLGEGVVSDSLGKPLAVGDRVIYDYFFGCGSCYWCLNGQPAACPRKLANHGTPCEEPPHFTGAYAEYYYVRSGQHIFKVPDELSDELVAPVNCALSEVMYGLDQVGVRIGDAVVIQGAGGLGLNATAVAKEMGAATVIVIDRLQERLNLAREFGADAVINMEEFSTPKARLDRVRQLTGHRRGADIVVEVVGLPVVIPEGIDMLRVGGTYLLIGNISRGLTVPFEPAALVGASRKMVGIATYEPWVLPAALDFLVRTQNKYPFHKLLSHKFKLEQINEAFQQADTRKVSRATIVMD